MKRRPGSRPFLTISRIATLSLLGMAPAAFAQTPWHGRAANRWEIRDESDWPTPRFSLGNWHEPWQLDFPALFHAVPQPQAAGQDLTVDNNTTYTVTGSEQWANVRVGNSNTGYIVQNPGTTMTLSGTLSLASALGSSGFYTLNGGTLSAAGERISAAQNTGGATFTQVNGLNSIGSGGLTLSTAAQIGTASNQGTYNLNGGTLRTPFVVNGGGTGSNFNFNGGTLQATGNNGSFMAGLTSANIQSGGAFIDSNGFAITIPQVLSGSGGLTKVGAGTLTLSNTNTYMGSTNVNAGTLVAGHNGTQTGTFAAGTSVNVNGGGTLQLTGTDSLGYYSGNLTLNINGGLVLTDGGANHTTLGRVTLTGGTLTANGPGDGTYGAIYLTGPLATFASPTTATINAANGGYVSLVDGGGSYVQFTVAKGTTASGVDLQVSAPLAGTTALIKSGAGTLSLTTANTYTGGTFVNAGTLVAGFQSIGVGGKGTFAPGSSVTVINGATLLLAGKDSLGFYTGTALGNLFINGGLVTTDGSANHTTIDTVNITGGTLTANGPGDGAFGAIYLNGPIYTGGGSTTATINAANGGYVSLIGGDTGGGSVTFDVAKGTTASGVDLLVSAPLTGSAPIIKNGAGTLSLTAANTFTGTTTINAGALLIGGTLNGGTYAANIADAGSFVYNGSAAQTLSGVISGTGALTEAGPGTLTLTGNNTYTGGTTLASGVLNLGSAGALGGSGTLSFTGGTLQYSSANQSDYSPRFSTASNQAYSIDTNGQNVTFATALTSSGGSLTKLGAGTLMLTGINTYSGATTIGAGTLLIGGAGALGAGSYAGNIADAGSFVYNSSAAQTLSGVVSGAGSLTQAGPGKLTLTGNNTYTGGTFVNAGTLVAGHENGTMNGTFAGGSIVTINSGGTLLLSGTDSLGFNSGNAGLNINGGLVTTDGRGHTTLYNLTMTSGTITANGPGDNYGSYFFRGPMVTYASSTTATFNASNGGSVSLLNGVSFTVAAGSTPSGVDLLVSVPLFSSGGVVKNGPGTLSLTGTDTYTGDTTVNAGTLAINGAGVLGGGSYAGNIADAGSFVYGSTAAQTLSGVISGAGTLTQAGPGTLTLTGNNTYTGGTTLASGVLNVGSAGALGGSGPISFNGGTLQYSPANQTDYSPRFSTAAGQAYSIDTNGQNVTLATGLTSNGGSLNVSDSAGGGTLTLTKANTYTGATTVSGGTLAIAAGGSITGNGTLTVNASGVTPAAMTLASGGSLSAGEVYIGNNGAGSFTQTEGSFANGAHQFFIGYGSGSTGAYTLGGGTLTTGPARIGYNGAGTFTQTGGSFTTNNNSLILGYGSGSTGTYTLGGSLSTGTAFIGYSGTGVFTQTGGGFTTNGSALYLGYYTRSNGTYNLDGGTLNVGQVSGGSGTDTFHFNGGTLQAGASSATFLQELTTADVRGGGASIDTNSLDVTVSQGLLHSTVSGDNATDGGLTKIGAGTLTLAGANSYTGLTTVSGGTLAIAAGGSITGNGTLTVNAARMTLAGGGSLSTGPAYIGYSGAANFTQTGGSFTTNGNSLVVGYQYYSNGTYTLSGDDSTLSTGPVYIGYAGKGSFTQTGGSFDTNGNALYISYITSPTANNIYTLSGGTLSTGRAYIGYAGAANFTQTGGTFTTNGNDFNVGYNYGTSTYTLGGGTLSTGTAHLGYINGGSFFTQTGGTFTTNGNVLNIGYLNRFDFNYSSAYTLGGGTLNVGSVTGQYTGSYPSTTFHFNGGMLQAAANNGSFFQGLTTADVQANGAYIDTAVYNVTVAQNLAHDTTANAPATDGGLTKLGPGTLTLSGANTYTGPTAVNAGTLLAGNPSGSATGTGAVTVNTGGTLGGNGTLAGAVTVANGGMLAPGALTVSRLTLGSTLTLQTGSTLAITLGGTTAGSGYDQVAVNGTLTLAGTLNVSTVNGFTLAVGNTFTILDNTGNTALTAGVFTNAPGTLYTDAAGQSFLVNYAANADGGLVANDVTLTYLGTNVVPEPGTWTLLALGALALAALRRRVRLAPRA